MPREIHIDQVLANIRAKPGEVFILQFVRATGKEKGTVKTVHKCMYGAALTEVKPEYRAATQRKRKVMLHIEHGTLPCHNYETKEYLTPLISHIIGYNTFKVVH